MERLCLERIALFGVMILWDYQLNVWMTYSGYSRWVCCSLLGCLMKLCRNIQHPTSNNQHPKQDVLEVSIFLFLFCYPTLSSPLTHFAFPLISANVLPLVFASPNRSQYTSGWVCIWVSDIASNLINWSYTYVVSNPFLSPSLEVSNNFYFYRIQSERVLTHY